MESTPPSRSGASLIEGLTGIRSTVGDPTSTAITDLTENSRLVAPGSLFVARRGERFDGTAYIASAVRAGAVAVMVEHGATLNDEARRAIKDSEVLVIEAADLARTTAVVAERFFGESSKRLRLIGVTGTNGKTTAAHLIHQMLNAAGQRCGLLGTVMVDDGRGARPAELTTPFAIELSRTLARMVEHGCTHAVMEVSSHALAQGRAAGLTFAGAIFTNLSGDHLDFHGKMENYAEAKAILFDSLAEDAWAIMNADDAHAGRMVRDCRARLIHTRAAREGEAAPTFNERATWFVEVRDLAPTAMRLRLDAPREATTDSTSTLEFETALVGRHNAMNVLQACAALHACGVAIDRLGALASDCTAPPGRLEPVLVEGCDFTLLVDYAHTDDALRNVLSAVRPIVPDGARLIVLFGCGGDRDRTKRPRMAEAACEQADVVLITSDNPRTEDPQAIVEDISRGVPRDRTDSSDPDREVVIEVDRRAAIQRAIHEIARVGDIIVIAGKGHEDYQIIGTEKRPFDDREIAREALRERFRGARPPAGQEGVKTADV